MDKKLHPLKTIGRNYSPMSNFNVGVVKSPLKLGNGWVITSHSNNRLTYSCEPLSKLISRGKRGPVDVTELVITCWIHSVGIAELLNKLTNGGDWFINQGPLIILTNYVWFYNTTWWHWAWKWNGKCNFILQTEYSEFVLIFVWMQWGEMFYFSNLHIKIPHVLCIWILCEICAISLDNFLLTFYAPILNFSEI